MICIDVIIIIIIIIPTYNETKTKGLTNNYNKTSMTATIVHDEFDQ